MAKFNPVRCTDGTLRAFVRVEFPVAREDVTTILATWRARRAAPGNDDLAAHEIREIVRSSFYNHGMAGEDDFTEPTDADRTWAEQHTAKVWVD